MLLEGVRVKQATGKSLWQDGYFERVLRSDEEYLPIAAYILANPVRADLCASIGEYPFSGADRYSLKELMEWVQSSTNGSRP